MPTVKEAIQGITNPLRRNDLEARRRKLGLSRVALGAFLVSTPRPFSGASEGRWSRYGTTQCAASKPRRRKPSQSSGRIKATLI